MELWFFERNWKEFQIEGKQVILLEDMIKRSRGDCKVDGYSAINFEAANTEIDRIVLTISNGYDGATYCLQWDEDRRKWITLGAVRFRPEWGAYQFIRSWEVCGIRLNGVAKVVPLKEIFSECLGEKFDGVSFIGKGSLEGKRPLLRLDTEARLSGHFAEQKCEMFNEATDEWEFWGMLVKKLPKRPGFA